LICCRWRIDRSVCSSSSVAGATSDVFNPSLSSSWSPARTSSSSASSSWISTVGDGRVFVIVVVVVLRCGVDETTNVEIESGVFVGVLGLKNFCEPLSS